MLFAAALLLLCIVAGSCSYKRAKPVPRPTAYPRIDSRYDTAYTTAFAPCNLQVNRTADVSCRGDRRSGGVTVKYEKYGAILYCSYNIVNSRKQLTDLLHRRAERVMLDSGGDPSSTFRFSDDSRNCHGILALTKQSKVTPIHFIATDSVEAVVSGTVVMGRSSAPDSISPILDYLVYDIEHLINNLNFKQKHKSHAHRKS